MLRANEIAGGTVAEMDRGEVISMEKFLHGQLQRDKTNMPPHRMSNRRLGPSTARLSFIVRSI